MFLCVLRFAIWGGGQWTVLTVCTFCIGGVVVVEHCLVYVVLVCISKHFTFAETVIC